MKAFCGSMSVAILALTFGMNVSAQETPAAKVTAKNATFDKLKTLKGDWEIVRAPGEHGAHAGGVSYKVIASGSALQETIFGGTDHEMVTLFYQDGEEMALTHYCMLQNRPVMREKRQSDPNKIVFACRKEDNLKIEAEDHMHEVTFTFTDADHVKAEWVMYKGGKADGAHAFEFVRRKKPQTAVQISP